MWALAALLLAGTGAYATPARPLVAVIDSGVAMTDELKPVLVGDYDFAAATPRTAYHPRYDHGTLVATILNRAAHGQVGIVSFRIDDPAGCPTMLHPPCQADGAPIVRAIRQAIAMKVAAINISLALKDDPAITDAVRDATAQGITVVLAAGNDGWDEPGNLDAAVAGYPRAVLVGALDAAGQPWAGTNRPQAHPARPYSYVWKRGVDVEGAGADGKPIWGTGTSFAAPVEAGQLFAPAGQQMAGLSAAATPLH